MEERNKIGEQIFVIKVIPLFFIVAFECAYKIGLSSPPYVCLTVHLAKLYHYLNVLLWGCNRLTCFIIIRYWPKSGPKLAQNWLKFGPKLAQKWPKIGSKLAQKWPKNKVVLHLVRPEK